MYSSSSSAMHHIVFPPRLKVVFLQQDPNCLASCPGDQFAFDRFLGHQPHGPTRIAWRGIGANHGDNPLADRKSTRLNSSHLVISYAVFCLKKSIFSVLHIFKRIAFYENGDGYRARRRRGVQDASPAEANRQSGEPQQESPDFYFFNDTATTEIYTLSLHDALPI